MLLHAPKPEGRRSLGRSLGRSVGRARGGRQGGGARAAAGQGIGVQPAVGVPHPQSFSEEGKSCPNCAVGGEWRALTGKAMARVALLKISLARRADSF